MCFEIGNYDASSIVWDFVKDCFVVWALVCFRLCFRDACPSSVKNALGALMGFAESVSLC